MNVTEEDLKNRIEEVEKAHINSKHGQSWKLINEITERNASKKGQLKGNTPNERLENWYNHFKCLLGNPRKYQMRMKRSLPYCMILT